MSCSDLSNFVRVPSSGTDCCKTEKVKCIGNQITTIIVSSEGFVDEPDFSKFQSLDTIILHNMNMGTKDYSSIIKDYKISEVPNLQFLEMTRMGITGSLDCELPKLSVLNLSMNNLVGDIPSCFNGPSQELNLNNNQISGLVPSSVADVTPVIKIMFNPIIGLSSYKATSLYLQYTKIPDLDLATVNRDINTLQVSFNLVNLEELTQFNNLTILMVLSAGMSGELPLLPDSLRQINLGGNSFSGPIKAKNILDCGKNIGDSFTCGFSSTTAKSCNISLCDESLIKSIISDQGHVTNFNSSVPETSSLSLTPLESGGIICGAAVLVFLVSFLIYKKRVSTLNSKLSNSRSSRKPRNSLKIDTRKNRNLFSSIATLEEDAGDSPHSNAEPNSATAAVLSSQYHGIFPSKI
eukprot:NODE_386_length_9538_cov_0.348766.p3 type:complete len:408 gc:universal NODE_386_length_9538_cov_0.348766:3534-4757(+)